MSKAFDRYMNSVVEAATADLRTRLQAAEEYGAGADERIKELEASIVRLDDETAEEKDYLTSEVDRLAAKLAEHGVCPTCDDPCVPLSSPLAPARAAVRTSTRTTIRHSRCDVGAGRVAGARTGRRRRLCRFGIRCRRPTSRTIPRSTAMTATTTNTTTKHHEREENP